MGQDLPSGSLASAGAGAILRDILDRRDILARVFGGGAGPNPRDVPAGAKIEGLEVAPPPGAPVLHKKTTLGANGAVLTPTSNTFLTGGPQQGGKLVGKLMPDGMVVAPDGRVVGQRNPKSGAVTAPPAGEILHASTTVWPDGTVLGAGSMDNGQYLGTRRPDGTVVSPTGIVIGSMDEHPLVESGRAPLNGATALTGATARQPDLGRFGRILGCSTHSRGGSAALRWPRGAVVPPSAHANASGFCTLNSQANGAIRTVTMASTPAGGPARGNDSFSASGGDSFSLEQLDQPATMAAPAEGRLSEYELFTDEGPVVVRARSSGTIIYLKQMTQARQHMHRMCTACTLHVCTTCIACTLHMHCMHSANAPHMHRILVCTT